MSPVFLTCPASANTLVPLLRSVPIAAKPRPPRLMMVAMFALAGQVKNTGLIEVPMGISLREIVEDMGGGVPGGGRIKAVQTGGPSGGCIPYEHLDMPVDYDSLQQVGSIMGSGGMIVMDESSNMVEVARYFMEFSMSESCGKCVPCRVGTYQMHEILTRMLNGRAGPSDLAMLEELTRTVNETSLCGLGQSAPNPIRSTLRYYRSEYEYANHRGRY
jgi:bidirectional [NiFe] hydrogenase diaphorase subunit